MDNNQRQYTFIQRLFVLYKNNKRAPIAPDAVISCDITETANMDGSIMILSLDDTAGQYRDNLHIAFESVIEVSFGDVLNKRGDLVIDNYVVISATSSGNTFNLECMQQTCYELKKPAKQPRFFVNKPPAVILSALVKGVKFKIECDNVASTYHLNAGASASRLIRTIARDHGCLAYYQRGVFYFVAIDKAIRKKTGIVFETGNTSAEYPIQNYKINDKIYIYERVLDKRFLRWSITAGMQHSVNDGDDNNGDVLITTTSKAALNNQDRAIIPTITIDCYGYIGFKAGLSCDVVLNVQQHDKVIDETLKERQLIERVTHHAKGNVYQCRMILGVCND